MEIAIYSGRRANRRSRGGLATTPCLPHRAGAVLVLIVLLLPVMLLLSAFAINLAYMELTRTEMHTAADAAARAAGREFTIFNDNNLARTRGKAIAEMNSVAGEPLSLRDSDFLFGTSTRVSQTGRYQFSAGGISNAVQLNVQRNSAAIDGPIPLLMPHVFGIGSFNAQFTSISTQIEVDVALVIDRSGSMAYAANEVAAYPPAPASAPLGWDFCHPAPPNSRWRNMVDGVAMFLNEVASSPASELVSLSTYASSPLTNQDLTSDYNLIHTALDVYTNSLCAGGTNIGDGIYEGAGALALSPLARPGAVKVIVLLTDGIHNIGSDPVSAAQTASENGVVIYTITFSDEANQSQMQAVAANGGGMHFHATTPADLIIVFQTIAKQLPTLLTQ